MGWAEKTCTRAYESEEERKCMTAVTEIEAKNRYAGREKHTRRNIDTFRASTRPSFTSVSPKVKASPDRGAIHEGAAAD